MEGHGFQLKLMASFSLCLVYYNMILAAIYVVKAKYIHKTPNMMVTTSTLSPSAVPGALHGFLVLARRYHDFFARGMAYRDAELAVDADPSPPYLSI
jgi:hypothetical protein